MRDVVIIGSGCAGLTAAIYAARANLNPLVVQGVETGGQLSLTTLVENFPGFPEGIQGPELIERMKEQAARFGAEFTSGDVSAANLRERPFKLTLENETLETHVLIIASGASAKWLGINGERQLIGKGVSSCATCDGAFFRNQRVAVVGGGDTAMEDAMFLTRFASQVELIHRRDEFRASPIMLDRARANSKIHFKINTVVDEIHDPAKDAVTGVTLRDVNNGKRWEEELGAVFVAIGHVPNTGIFKDQLEMDSEGYLHTRNAVETNIPGVFACGDCQDRVFRQAVTAAGSGCAAAISAERFLKHEHNR